MGNDDREQGGLTLMQKLMSADKLEPTISVVVKYSLFLIFYRLKENQSEIKRQIWFCSYSSSD